MSEQTKIKHSPAVEGKKHHKVRWIVLAVLLVIVAAVAAWYLIRFEFNRDYQAYIEAPKGAAAAVRTGGAHRTKIRMVAAAFPAVCRKTTT